MNTEPNSGLDSFDRALLTELRQVAAEGAPAPVRRTRRRWAYAGGSIAAAAVTAFGLTTLGSSAAYAVDETSGGDIVITIHELSDADGLEQALADHGIDADVDYESDNGIGGSLGGGPDGSLGSGPDGDLPTLPDGADSGTVAQGHGSLHSESGSASEGPGTSGDPADDSPCGGPDDLPFTGELNKDDYVITIPENSVLRDNDAVMRITTSGDVADQVAGIQVTFSVGDADCGFGTMTANAG